MAKTYLERHFPDVPEDLTEINGEIFIYRDFEKRPQNITMTPCNIEGPDMCIHWGVYDRPRPCDECINLGYSNGKRKLFHDTGDKGNG